MKSTWIPHGYFKLPVDPKCIQVFPIFLQYLEKQHVKIDIDNVLPLLMLAVEYDSMVRYYTKIVPTVLYLKEPHYTALIFLGFSKIKFFILSKL